VKCADLNCGRQAKIGSAYCSDTCAPTAPRATGNTRYGRPTGSSNSEASTDHSDPYSDDENTGENETDAEPTSSDDENTGDTTSERTTPEDESESSRRERRKKSANISGRTAIKTPENGESGMSETESEKMQRSLPAKMPETLPASLNAPATNSPPEGSTTRNLIEDSVRDLRGMMHSAAKVVRRTTRAEGNARLDPALINAAANCSKQMASLMRLQLDWSKHVHGAEREKAK